MEVIYLANKVFKFTKDQILGSIRYLDKKDLLTALLDEDKEYTLQEVDKIIKVYEEKEV